MSHSDAHKHGRTPFFIEGEDLGFDTMTPLWFYILEDAGVKHGGQRLGDVGSRLVVETFHGLVEGSDRSILGEPDWKPTLPAQHADRFTMKDLRLFADDVNPIGE
jgi:hypothetical protein